MAEEILFVAQKSRPTLLQQSRKVQDLEAKQKFWGPHLKNLDARKNKDSRVRELEREIRDLACRLEDVLEAVFNKVQPRRDRRTKTNLRKFARLVDDINSSRMVRREFKEINNRDTQIRKTMELLQSFHILDRIENEDQLEYHNIHPTGHYVEQRTEDYIVGKDPEVRDLKTKLREKRIDFLQSICIYGMAGIGKTTLAEQLYNDLEVKVQFERRARVLIGQGFIIENILIDILKQISPESKGKEWPLDIQLLKYYTLESLKGKKYFVVFDDIQSADVWDSLCSCFPEDHNGSRIMFTTRTRAIATHLAGNEETGIIHLKRLLTESESSDLFWKIAFSGDPDEVGNSKEKIGKTVFEICKGLPSDIVAIGEVLATKDTLQEWKVALQNIDSLLTRGLRVHQIEIEKLTTSDFEDLPYHLKPCFLYMRLFPKGLKIEVEKLYFLWMAEGMITLYDCKVNETMMDLAERYLNDLVRRKMVDVEEGEISSLRKYKFCWVHERMHDHCLPKGEEYFFEVLDVGLRARTRARRHSSLSLTCNFTRRLALHLHKQDDGSHVDQLKTELFSHIWSLMAFNLQNPQMQCEFPREISDLKTFRKLKILTFEGIDFKKRDLPRGLTKLTFLRYLNFRGCILDVLPSSVGELSYLETLDLQVSNLIIIPNVLNKLEKLRYLYLPLMFKTATDDKLRLGSLIELETLENFHTGMCDVADLFKMMNLRQLSTTVEGDAAGLGEIVKRLNLQTPVNQNVLHPHVNVTHFDCYTEERHSVFRKLLSCEILHTLRIDGHLERIPPYYEISTSLTQIVLKGSQLKEDPMTTFEKLKKLQVLVLEEESFLGKKMNCSAYGFPELKRLELLNLSCLETWAVKGRAMHKLSVLVIKNCSKLKTKWLRFHFLNHDIKFEIDDGYHASFT